MDTTFYALTCSTLQGDQRIFGAEPDTTYTHDQLSFPPKPVWVEYNHAVTELIGNQRRNGQRSVITNYFSRPTVLFSRRQTHTAYHLAKRFAAADPALNDELFALCKVSLTDTQVILEPIAYEDLSARSSSPPNS